MKNLYESILDDEDVLNRDLDKDIQLKKFYQDILNANSIDDTDRILDEYNLRITDKELDELHKAFFYRSGLSAEENYIECSTFGNNRGPLRVGRTSTIFSVSLVMNYNTDIFDMTLNFGRDSISFNIEYVAPLLSEILKPFKVDLMSTFKKSSYYKRIKKFADTYGFKYHSTMTKEYGEEISLERKI